MPNMAKASITSASVGFTAGMIPFTKEFVTLDKRPVIFTGTGI